MSKLNVESFNLLEHLDYVSYDAGTGQLMLKNQLFYTDLVKGKLQPKYKTLESQLDKLLIIQKEGHQWHFAKKEKELAFSAARRKINKLSRKENKPIMPGKSKPRLRSISVSLNL